MSDMTGSAILSNRADYGDGIWNYCGTATLKKSDILGNVANSKGGGIWWYGIRPTIDLAITVIGNIAPEGPNIYPY